MNEVEYKERLASLDDADLQNLLNSYLDAVRLIREVQQDRMRNENR